MFTTDRFHGCHCVHHTIVSVLMILAWISVIGYFMAYWFGGSIYIFDAQYFFEVVVMLSLISLTTKFCTCCEEVHHNACRNGSCLPENNKNGVMMCCLDDKGNCMHSK